MEHYQTDRLEQILQANQAFKNKISADKLPVQRLPESLAVITCMDPRINLEAVGIRSFSADGAGHSSVRIIRTIGGMADDRSLIIGIFLACIKEIVVLMHTDCGCCLAHSKIDKLIENLNQNLDSNQLQAVKETIGAPFREKLRNHLQTFEEPKQAIRKEISRIKALPFIPNDIIFHGLLYDVATGSVELVTTESNSQISLSQ